MAVWHLITGEYPPQVGGVSDYTRLIAEGLATAGDSVHVWCPPAAGASPEIPGVVVHRELGGFTPSDLRRVGSMLNGMPAPCRLLVQWVPHSYGYRSLNLAFCAWLWVRVARYGDRVEIMVHEPWLDFDRRSWRQSAAALVHRLMTAVLLRAAQRVWMSTRRWEGLWRPYALGRRIPFVWLPLPNGVPVVEDPEGVAEVRSRYLPAGETLLGHFGTFGRHITEMLTALLPSLLGRSGERGVLLIGRGSEEFRESLLALHPDLAGRVHATGVLSHPDISRHLAACDLLVQPYPDGVSTRRTSLLAGIAHGIPTVTTHGPATEALWSESGAVALAPGSEPLTVAALIESLLADPEARRRLGHAGRRLYESRLALSRTIQELRSTPSGTGLSGQPAAEHLPAGLQ
ncbi:MAG TPA: glycosyltransferase family 4 protein [Longimicrobiaceae bacterium]|nr:glycosyltransferase family 4 protein [Longimicrobiaceae bacterium]